MCLRHLDRQLPHSPLEQVGVAAANLREMVGRARRAGVRRVLLADVLPIEKTTRAQAAKVRRLNRAIRAIGRSKGVERDFAQLRSELSGALDRLRRS